mgnify:CR=1 FL=1
MKEFLNDYKKVVILGIGNEIKSDDGLGPVIVKKLSELFKDNLSVVCFDGGTVPENYTGSIRKENPTHIILIDAVQMKKVPGYIRVVKKDEIANYNISTHAMPVSFLIKYMETTIHAEIILVGVQPKSMELNEKISREVKDSIDKVVHTIEKVLNHPKDL